MATEKPRITITLDEDTLRRVEEFRHKNRISTLSKAASKLIELGLSEWEELPVSDEEIPFDPVEQMEHLKALLDEMHQNMIKNRERKGE